MDQEQQEILRTVADYSDCKERLFIRKIHIASICGILAWVISFVFMLCFADVANGVGILLIGEAIAMLLYGCGMFCVKSNRTTGGYLTSLIGAFISVVISNLGLMMLFFGAGSYHNHGIIGGYYAFLIILAAFGISGIAVSLVNQKMKTDS